MKLTIAILFCVILTLQYDGANGELKDLFGRIHGSVTKVKQDVHNLFNPNEKKQQEPESTNIHFVEDESEEVDFAAAAAARKPVEPTPAPTPSTTTLSPTSTTAENATEKDGRENFAGGCVAGFMRTPDGRCKPTF